MQENVLDVRTYILKNLGEKGHNATYSQVVQQK